MDALRLARRAGRPPENLRIIAYRGHGSGTTAVMRGRVLDDPEPPEALEGEGVGAAVRRTIARFDTHELPGVPLRVRLAEAAAEVETDAEGYFDAKLQVELTAAPAGWVEGEVGLRSPYRGLAPDFTTPFRIRVPDRHAGFGVISDIDDTILQTGAQRALTVMRNTLTGSALTRTPFAGAAELYRALAEGGSGPDHNPLFYVSSSPWNLYGFLAAFIEHRGFPQGPLLLRDLLGAGERRPHHAHKGERIDEVLAVHSDLAFVLVGDSGQHDPEIYAEAVRRHPARILAVYIREVRLDPGDGRVEAITDTWDQDVPFVLAADSAVVAEHAADLGLLDPAQVDAVRRATANG